MQRPWVSSGPWYIAGVPYSFANPYVASESRSDVAPDYHRTLARGYLRLFVYPTTAQIYVDGFFVGTVDDVRLSSLALEPGPHRIELRETGYETVTFDVRITSDETITVRRDLVRIPEPPAPVRSLATPAVPKTFYVIPGCYAGDRRSEPGRLPSACNIAALEIRRH